MNLRLKVKYFIGLFLLFSYGIHAKVSIGEEDISYRAIAPMAYSLVDNAESMLSLEQGEEVTFDYSDSVRFRADTFRESFIPLLKNTHWKKLINISLPTQLMHKASLHTILGESARCEIILAESAIKTLTKKQHKRFFSQLKKLNYTFIRHQHYLSISCRKSTQ